MSRKPLMAGNWKMNLDHIEAADVVQKLAETLSDFKYDKEKSEAVVIVPFTDLKTVKDLIEGDELPIGFGTQDVSIHDEGAYTGEVSATMLAKLNCSYVLVGHSERREYHDENDKLINGKTKIVAANGMIPIVCVGEKPVVRKQGRHLPFILTQVYGTLVGLTPEQVATAVVAYEPIWAIGTGEVASPEDIQEVCMSIRYLIAKTFGTDAASAIRILYGGSVNSSNIAEIMAQPAVDGALVGGASLDPEDFARIVTFYDR